MASIFDPFFLTNRSLRREIRELGRPMRGLLVDIGCGTRPYQSCFPDAEYLGIEVPQGSLHGSAKRADLFFDGLHIPIRDGSASHVLCTQVLEHVFEPDEFLREVFRILAPGGTLLLTVPFVWDEHEQPYDYARYSSFGLRYLARRHEFLVVTAHRTLADTSLFAQLWLAYLFKVLRPLPGSIRKPLLAAMSMPTNVAGLALGKLLPSSPDLYLDNVMVWAKHRPAGESR